MKKQTKKKLENDLATAIRTILAGYDSHAISKTNKAIKQSVKSVIKKFNKTSKALTKKKEAVKAKRKTTKKTTKKAPVRKSVVAKPAAVKYPRTKKKPANNIHSIANAQPLTGPVGVNPEIQ